VCTVLKYSGFFLDNSAQFCFLHIAIICEQGYLDELSSEHLRPLAVDICNFIYQINVITKVQGIPDSWSP
jgi:hypothetical protein